MSTKIKVIIIAAVVVFFGVIAVGGAAVYYFVTNTPKNTYLLSEQESAKSWKDYFNDRFENEAKFQDKMKDESYETSLKLGVSLPESLISELNVPKSVIDSTNIVFNVGHDPKKEKSKLGITPTIADNKIGKFQWSADNKNQYVETPLFDDIYKVKNNEIIKGLEKISGEPFDNETKKDLTNESLNLNTILSGSQVSQDKIDKISKKYSDLVIDQLDDDNFKSEKEKVKIFDDEKKLKKVTMNLSNKDTKKITVAVLKEAKKDKDLKDIVKKQGDVKEYDKQLDDLLKDAQKQETSKYPKIKSIIYVDGKEILKRDLTITGDDNTKLKLVGTNVIDDGVKVDYKVTVPGEEGSLSIKGKSTDGDQIHDKYDIEFKENEFSSTKVKFDNKSKVDGSTRKDNGKLTFTMPNSEPFNLNYKHNLDSDTKNNKQKQKLDIDFDLNGETIKVMLDGKTELKKDIKFKKDGAKDVNKLSDSDIEDINKEVEDKFTKITEDVLDDIQ
ncbi:DUF6583 family protein [Mammaliicoccus stepanovicii]|uniref:Uncharacterized protein n=1 Tax=Mammaliicoccus stepanovicii TaxID=643214 RepID=A0A239YHI1_9STAP|nr:DUF6583 family protein [Mammaliicoccus stepanovicii]PNZ77864.1 hypothetical protein CD111_03240 [Mammaliicoccus stepanovicii]GGI40899.1 hypothetical protein GCM10010896_10670 [Mammaliicoccus stepanovicii]SNV58589.1 Uncharacterised protein [Mammaliicoccus stepanovicii]